VNPYQGAVVLVNVDAAHNNGQPLAPALVTAVNPGGTVNVRVTYDGPPEILRHRPEHLTGVAFHDTTDPAAANSQGLYGAFWPQSGLATIQQEVEKIMTVQSDIDAAVATLTAAASTVSSAAATVQTVAADLGTVQAEVQNALAAFQQANPAVDTTDLNAAVAAFSGPLSSLQTAATALQTADSALDSAASSAASASGSTPAPSEPAPAPAVGTAGSTVNAGDAGSAA
jgi:hypothetical protein